jgi:hypothetical protein
MTHHWDTDASDPAGLDFALDDETVPGIPRGSKALAPLGALAGGGLAGLVLGISGGPMGVRVGAGIGAAIGLLAYVAVRSRRSRASAARPARSHPVLRFFALLLGVLLTLTGVGTAILIGLFLGDDRIGGPTTLGMAVFSAALLVAGSAVLWPSARRTRDTRQTRGERPLRSVHQELRLALEREQRLRAQRVP